MNSKNRFPPASLFICLIFLCFYPAQQIFSEDLYDCILLGRLDGNRLFSGIPGQSYGYRINNQGYVVGVRYSATSEPHVFMVKAEDTDDDGRPDLWYRDENGDHVNDFIMLWPGRFAFDVNEIGQVVGQDPAGDACMWEVVESPRLPGRRRERDPGCAGDDTLVRYTKLCGLGAWSEARRVNNLGQVVGTVRLSGHVYIIRPFIWVDGVLTLLGTLGGENSLANGINNLGMVVGCADDHDELAYAMLIIPEDTDEDGLPDCWYRDDDEDGDNDLMINLGTLGLANSQALAINDLGQIVGDSGIPSGKRNRRGFLLTPEDTDEDGAPDLWFRDDDADGINDLMTNLGQLSSHETWDSYALDVNNFGQVVGYSATDSEGNHGFLWENGELKDLNDIPHTSLSRITDQVSGINDAGQITGQFFFGIDTSGYAFYHAAVLAPVLLHPGQMN